MTEIREDRRHTSLAELDAAVAKAMREMGYDAYERETRRIAEATFAELKPLLRESIAPAGGAAAPQYAVAEGHNADELARSVNAMLKQGYRLMNTPPFRIADGDKILLGREMVK